MSDDSKLPPKVYFRIGEVASLVGVEPHVLRYWEREFRTIRPRKSARGQRVYSRKDVETLMRVRQLLYSEGFTIAGARRRLQQERAGNGAALEPAEIANQAEASEEEDARVVVSSHASANAAPAQLTLETVAAAPISRPHVAAAMAAPALAPIASPAGPASAMAPMAPMTPMTPMTNGHAHAASADGTVMRATLRELRREIETFLEDLGSS